MKANKFFAAALAALTLVSFSACDKKNNGGDEGGSEPSKPGTEATLVLDQTSLQLEVEGTATLKATVAAEWASNNEAVATVTPGNDGGMTALVKAVAEGNAVITATTAGGQVKTCVVLVQKAQPQGGEGVSLKGSQFWPIIMDGTTLEANESKMVASFQPNDVDQFLYVWENTYVGGTASGMNFHGNGDGYTALVVGGSGWAGMGFCLTDKGNGWEAAEALRAAIVAAPDDYFLHLAIKATDNGSHCFYLFGSEDTKFVLGANSVYEGPVYQDFARDGSWAEFDIPMSRYATALSSVSCVAGVNVFVALSEGTQGLQLNLDAVYFYKK